MFLERALSIVQCICRNEATTSECYLWMENKHRL